MARRSERIDPDQIALGLEDLEPDEACAEAKPAPPAKAKNRKKRKSGRKPLPDNLPGEEVRVDVSTTVCACGGTLHPIGESVSEMLDWVRAKFRVIRICRPKYGCRACGTVSQAPAPERPIAGGLAAPALFTQVLVSKYCDHTPLYRQSQIYARLGVDLDHPPLGPFTPIIRRTLYCTSKPGPAESQPDAEYGRELEPSRKRKAKSARAKEDLGDLRAGPKDRKLDAAASKIEAAHLWFKVGYRGMPATEAFFLQQGLQFCASGAAETSNQVYVGQAIGAPACNAAHFAVSD